MHAASSATAAPSAWRTSQPINRIDQSKSVADSEREECGTQVTKRPERAAHLLVVNLVLLEERGEHAEALLRAVGSHAEDAAEEHHASAHADQNHHPLACEWALILKQVFFNDY